jgi:membrane-bound lytic murein transglycosylase D
MNQQSMYQQSSHRNPWILKALFCGWALSFLSACSTFTKQNEAANKGADGMVIRPAEIATFRASEPEPPEMQVPEFDNIPEDVQPHVQKWLNYFQGRGREHMERYLSRSSRYERLMKKILRENEIPEDIIYVALIESGFSPRAISRSRAVGYWQFIRGTGKRYGLAINTFVDERRDPVLATQAAADYFKGLYGEFNSWFLAMASYNVGEGRVRREINRNRTRDFWVLAKRRRLPKETLNYVPKFLAARLIAKNPEAYGFRDIPYEPPIEFETAAFSQAVNMKTLADKINVDYAELKRLNPRYRGEVAPLYGKSVELRLPLNMKEAALAVASEVTVKDLVFIPDRGETDVYKVRSGDTLLKIARRFKTSVAFLREINDFKRRSRLKPGRTIFVPVPSVAMPKATVANVKTPTSAKTPSDDVAKASKESAAANPEEALYLVQEGESLAEIAVKNNMTMEELMELNSFTEGQVLSVGMQLRVKKIQPEAGEPSLEDLPSSVETSVAANEGVNKAQEKATGTSKEEAKDSEATVSGKISLEEEVRKSVTHRVRPGETLYGIATLYRTSIEAIQKANKMGRRRVLRAGALLKIPNEQEKRTSRSSLKKTKSSERRTFS